MLAQARQRAALVAPHQAGVADNVRSEDRRQFALLTGDGALVEFPSAVDALNAAIAFQQAVTEANQDQPEDTRIVFRIGLHLGDLIVDADDLCGDGANVAARLHGPQ
jgi:class 3 adenylate cyclase